MIGYAYDDRWKRMTVREFVTRRFIRLHPMVVIGAVIGAVMFYFQGCSVWDVSKVSVTMLLAATLMNACMIPATPGMEIRGVTEMFPLNGPSWSLFYEYIGNISLTGDNIAGGSLRLLFSFSAGLLMSRVFRPVKVKGAFWICSLGVVVLLAVPRIGGEENYWMNGLYDTLCFALAFPLLVYLGASGKTTDRTTARICKFMGDISYPLYMVHYPFIYLYYAWVKNGNLTFAQSLPGAAALVIGSVLLAYLCLKLYDEPVRRFLTKHLLRTQKPVRQTP